MKAEDLPEIFVLFYDEYESPKKFTYFGKGSWEVKLFNKNNEWQYWDHVCTKTVLQHWEDSKFKFKIVWPEEYGE
jgi:ubiquitin-protein ligase